VLYRSPTVAGAAMSAHFRAARFWAARFWAARFWAARFWAALRAWARGLVSSGAARRVRCVKPVVELVLVVVVLAAPGPDDHDVRHDQPGRHHDDLVPATLVEQEEQ